MIIGVPREIKKQENRVGLNPDSVREIVAQGHDVIVEANAGQGISATDDDYIAAGATIVSNAKSVFDRADMIVKVKEPQPVECEMLRSNQILFTYLHLAPDPRQAIGLMDSDCIAIAYETVTGEGGKGLPLLKPMSEVAGRMAPLMGAFYGSKNHGGLGRLVSGVLGTPSSKVLIIGGGVSGFAAAEIAAGMRADVTVLDINEQQIEFLNNHFDDNVSAFKSTPENIAKFIKDVDMVIGAVLVPGDSAPKLVTADMVAAMKSGAVMVDIAIDQGGCFETSHATTHEDPIYIVNDVVHYCVANMPGAYPETATAALNNATLPYVLALANKGWRQALLDDEGLIDGLNVKNGKIMNKSVAKALGMDYNPFQKVD